MVDAVNAMAGLLFETQGRPARTTGSHHVSDV
jgi:hypothetical protein